MKSQKQFLILLSMVGIWLDAGIAAGASSGAVVAWGDNTYGQTSVAVAKQSGVTAIAAGYFLTVALTTNGTVIGSDPVPVGAQAGVMGIAEGYGHTVALINNGSVVAWGYDSDGQATVPVAAQSGVTTIAAGWFHTVALKNDGSIVAWGWNSYGQTTVPVSAQSGVIAIAAGRGHTVVLKHDGSVLAWGDNTYGQTSIPLGAQGRAMVIAAGSFHTVALVPPGPVIITQPSSHSVNAGESASFTVVAAGYALNYQWRFNGNELIGETNPTLSLAGVNTNQSGFYEVMVMNAFGWVTSSNVTLTVVQPPIVFTNTTPISIPRRGQAFPYPSTITVSGMTNPITNLKVTLSEMSHTYVDDISVLLVGPSGQNVVLMSEAGGYLNRATVVFDDYAPTFLPGGEILSGTYRPTDHEPGKVFYPPAPAPPYSSDLSVFNGTDPNGVWKLFVIDFVDEDWGAIAGGWAISWSTNEIIRPGSYLTWSTIPSPQFTNAPFTVTLQARDASNQIDTNFSGTVALRDAATGGVVSNSILPSPPHDIVSSGGSVTLGYSFTPNTNLTVNAVRHYFGTKVSIWTDAGALLAAQPVTSILGTWVETPLSVPVQLTAGTRYRVGAYTIGNSFGVFGFATTFPDGTIQQGYSGSGDAFPSTPGSFGGSFVDLRYTAPAVPVQITPTNSGAFTNGVWSGVIRVLNPATNLVLLADDGFAHYGSSTPFHVIRSNQGPLIITPPLNQIVQAGANATFSPNIYGAPTLTYQWRRNGTNLVNGGRVNGANAAVLIISNVTASDAALYAVSVNNPFGGALSSSAMLAINPVDHFTWSPVSSPVSTLAPFAVSIQARDFLNNVATNFSGTVTLSAASAGSGNPVSVSPTVLGPFVAGVWNGNLSIPQTATDVVLRAVDGFGDIGLSSPFDTAQIAAFTLQPTNQNVLPGTNATLTAFAVGTGTVRYQWRFEGTNIPGATNASHSFTGANLTNHHGNFSVVATDDISTTVSSNAFIYVLVKPGIVQHMVSQSVLQGESLTFTLIATGAPPLWFRWVKGGVSYATTSIPVLVITNIQASTVLRVGVTNEALPSGAFSPGPNSFQNVNITMIPDADGDGLPDAWELAFFGNSTNAVASADFDVDGMSNEAEYIAGTNPTNQLSCLKIDSVAPVGSGRELLLLEFTAVSNKTYTLQYRDEIGTGGWGNLLDFTSAPIDRIIYSTNVIPPATTNRYYRLVTPRQGGE